MKFLVRKLNYVCVRFNDTTLSFYNIVNKLLSAKIFSNAFKNQLSQSIQEDEN